MTILYHGKFRSRILAISMAVFVSGLVPAIGQKHLTKIGYSEFINADSNRLKNLEGVSAQSSQLNQLNQGVKDRFFSDSTSPLFNKSWRIDQGRLQTGMLSQPLGTYNNIQQIQYNLDFLFLGVKSAVFSSVMFRGGVPALPDVSVQMNPAQSLKETARFVSDSYSNVMNSAIRNELTTLRSLHRVIEIRASLQIDSVLAYVESRGYRNYADFGVLNFENISGNGNNVFGSLQQLDTWLEGLTPVSGADYLLESSSRQVKELMSTIETLQRLNIKETINRYEELVNAADKTLESKPGRLRKLVRKHNLPFKFNPLWFAREIKAGSSFEGASFRQPGSSMSAGMIQQGLGVTLNGLSQLRVAIGADVTERFDRFWMPGESGSLVSAGPGNFQEFGAINATISLKSIEALGGLDVNLNNSSNRQAANSFFGLDRVHRSLALNRSFSFGDHSLSLSAETHFTSFQNNESTNLHIPQVDGSVQSYDVTLMYHGAIPKKSIHLSGFVRIGSQNGVTQLRGLQRAGRDVEFRFSRKLKRGTIVAFDAGNRVYSMGPGTRLENINLNTRISAPISRKHLIELRTNLVQNSSSGLSNPFWSSQVIGSEVGHLFSFKKHAKRYRIYTKATIRRITSDFSFNPGMGVTGEFLNRFSLTLPNQLSFFQVTSYSFNTVSQSLFLTANRFTMEPGVSVVTRVASYSTNLVYEKVAGFYEQCGARFCVSVSQLFNRISFTLSSDLRYTFREQQRVFNAPVVGFGSAGVQYKLK